MRLIVADDAALLREGLAGLLERQGHDVIAQAASAIELEAVVDRAMSDGAPPDVVLTDVRMPPSMTDDGLRAALALRGRYPQVGILLLSQYVAPAYAAELFAPTAPSPARAGTGGAAAGPGAPAASPVTAPGSPSPVSRTSPVSAVEPVGGVGYLLKDRISRVADFIRSLGIVAAGGVVVDPEVAARLLQGKRSALDALTPRELEVLQLMASGLSNQQIGTSLFLSPGAVAKHVANVFAKLNLGPGEDNRRVRAVLAYLTEQGV